jgi:hypothetical protein
MFEIDLHDVGTWLIILLAADKFLGNLMEKVPALKSNTPFQALANTVDAAVTTVKEFKTGDRFPPCPTPDNPVVPATPSKRVLPGPAGPTGATGATGPQGPAEPAGPAIK